jgi:hypothetical protein
MKIGRIIITYMMRFRKTRFAGLPAGLERHQGVRREREGTG